MNRFLLAFVFLFVFPFVTNCQTITAFAGGGASDTSDGIPAIDANIEFASEMVVDKSGNLIFGEFFGCKVRKIDAEGNIWTIAGRGIFGVSDGDGGPATAANLSSPCGIALDTFGNIYISEANGHRIRKINAPTGIISTIAGTGVMGFGGR